MPIGPRRICAAHFVPYISCDPLLDRKPDYDPLVLTHARLGAALRRDPRTDRFPGRGADLHSHQHDHQWIPSHFRGHCRGARQHRNAYNSSRVRLSGGTVNDVYFYNSSTLNVFGGILSNHITSYDNSTVNFSGGALALDFRPTDHSRVNFTGGSIGQNLQASGNSILNFSGGSVARGSFFTGFSAATISGGTYGQNVGINFFLKENSALTLVGTHLSLTDLGVDGSLGEKFAIDGRLADGTDLTGYRLIKDPAFVGTVTLKEVPEPGNIALLSGLSLTGFAAFMRRCKPARKAS